MKVGLPDGTVVTACSLAERRAKNSDRDFGLYMDARWQPTWPAYVIPWPDFGPPEDGLAAARAIARAFDRARNGERGALGRTGTVIACMAVLAGVPAKDAVAWVRTNYQRHAIETPEQEQWVSWFDKRVAAGDVTGSPQERS